MDTSPDVTEKTVNGLLQQCRDDTRNMRMQLDDLMAKLTKCEQREERSRPWVAKAQSVSDMLDDVKGQLKKCEHREQRLIDLMVASRPGDSVAGRCEGFQ
jgi:hypothetical protein